MIGLSQADRGEIGGWDREALAGSCIDRLVTRRDLLAPRGGEAAEASAVSAVAGRPEKRQRNQGEQEQDEAKQPTRAIGTPAKGLRARIVPASTGFLAECRVR